MKYPDIKQFREIAIDTETTGLEVFTGRDKAFSFSMSTPYGKDYYWDLRQDSYAITWLTRALDSFAGNIVFANAPFDYFALKHVGVDLSRELEEMRFRDVIGRACLIDEHLMTYKLDNLAKKYLGLGKVDIVPELAAIFGGRKTQNVQMRNLHKAPAELVGKYAMRDTRATLDLYYWQEKEIARQGIESIVKFEETITPVVIGMMSHGIRVDTEAAEKAMRDLTPHIDSLQKQIDDLTGVKEFNVNSSPQIREIFKPRQSPDDDEWYTKDGILLPKTKTGGASLDKTVLRDMNTPLSNSIMELRSQLKTRDTFLGQHVLEHQVNGRIHPSINQNKGEDGGTGTGRLSISNPAMQQIPSRNKTVAEIVKGVFLPDEGQVWVDSDLASFEVRVFAHLINNPVVNNIFAKDPNTDFHQLVGDMTHLPRIAEYPGQPNAKQLNLAMIFNQGRGATAEAMGMPWEWDEFIGDEGKLVRYKKPGLEAATVIENYHKQLPGVREFADAAKATAERRGYVKTKFGRRLRFTGRERRFSYKASGLLIQSNAADWNKLFIREIYRLCKEMGGSLLLNTHDSYGKSMPPALDIEKYREIANLVSNFQHSRVPLILEINQPGKNWWQSAGGERMI
jgi:DNA polymerase I-like protein with 3'-5' exonuclease and polymerase domains